MFTNTNAPTAPTRRRRRRASGVLAALAAAVALGAVVAGTAASSAEARTVYWGIYPDISSGEVWAACEYGFADQNATTRTRYLEIGAYENADGPVQLQYVLVVDGVWGNSSGWYNVAPQVNWRFSLGQSSGPGQHVVVQAQFRNWINGRWVYSPSGAWATASHAQKVTLGGTLYYNVGTDVRGCYL